MSHDGIGTRETTDAARLGLAEGTIAGARSAPGETAGSVRGPGSGATQGDVASGGSAGGSLGGRRAGIPRGADSTLKTLAGTQLTDAQLLGMQHQQARMNGGLITENPVQFPGGTVGRRK